MYDDASDDKNIKGPRNSFLSHILPIGDNLEKFFLNAGEAFSITPCGTIVFALIPFFP